jgi:preprotein translocase subunit SecE
MLDRILLGAAVLLVVAGLAGYYVFTEQSLLVRVGAVLAGVLVGGALAWLTEPGKRFYLFAQESVAEARKVVWPTRKDTLQTTLVVFLLVVVMGFFLWIVDMSLFVLVQRLMGRSE